MHVHGWISALTWNAYMDMNTHMRASPMHCIFLLFLHLNFLLDNVLLEVLKFNKKLTLLIDPTWIKPMQFK